MREIISSQSALPGALSSSGTAMTGRIAFQSTGSPCSSSSSTWSGCGTIFEVKRCPKVAPRTVPVAGIFALARPDSRESIHAIDSAVANSTASGEAPRTFDILRASLIHLAISASETGSGLWPVADSARNISRLAALFRSPSLTPNMTVRAGRCSSSTRAA